MDDIFRLDDKVAIVVGGGGYIGGAFGHGLSRYGAKVALADINIQGTERVATDIEKETSLEAVAFYVDVTDEHSIIELVEQVKSRFGTFDILVNAQGKQIQNLPSEFPVEDWDLIFSVNTRGTMLTCREFGKVMIEKKKGKIINISSIRGIRYTPWSGNEGYCASKAGVDMITRALACEWAPYNINVNAIAPSHVETSQELSPSLQIPERLEHILDNTPLKRIAQPHDLVGTCVFLASSASDYMTGQILYLDGGMTALAS